jgi:glycosyltransferase involved in cell wall biosynthesis
VAEAPLTVGLNLLGLPTLVQGGAGMMAGLEARELARREDVELRVLAGETVAGELAGSAQAQVAAGRSGAARRFASRALELADPYRYMSDVAPAGAFADCDVVHYPLSFLVAPPHEAPSVLTCVDLQHLFHPEFFSAKDRFLRRIRWDRAAKQVARVSVSSRFVQGSIEERLGIPAERIDVVGACCNPRFAEPPAGELRLDADYLLYPASPLPAKNHGRLLEAFSQLGPQHAAVRLVLVGPQTHDWSPVRARVEELGLGERVEVRGHVSMEQLVDLYAGARALVFPSLFEGFGIPVLEAMTVGCPVAAAEVTSIPEVCGEAAVLFDPTSIEAIRGGIETVLGMPDGDRRALLAAGAERASHFSAAALVDRQVGAFCRAAATIRR